MFLRRLGVNEKNGIQWRPYKHISYLDYADDVSFLSCSSDGLKEMCKKLNNHGEPECLKINAQKTKIMRNTRANPSNNEQITLHDINIEEVDLFTYLGSLITSEGGAEIDVKNRINKARSAFGMVSKDWLSNQINLHTNIKIFNSNVKSVLLHACKTWKVTIAITNQLQAYINKCLHFESSMARKNEQHRALPENKSNTSLHQNQKEKMAIV
jgi:hypothetical protein